MKIQVSGDGALRHVYICDDKVCTLYILEVGLRSGLVCLEYERGKTCP